jgi:hypothetical protein
MLPLFVGTKVRFCEPWEERAAPRSGSDYWVRARFGDYITPWIEAWKLERVN